MQDLRQHFQRIDEPRPGSVEEVMSVNRNNAALATGPQPLEMRPHRRRARLGHNPVERDRPPA